MGPGGDAGGFAGGNVAGEVLILRAESVVDPGAEAGESGEATAGDEGELGGGVVDAVGLHGADEGDLVDDFLKMGQEVGDFAAALAAFRERPGASHYLLG